MALTTEQLALINNLMYANPDSGLPIAPISNYENKTVREWLNTFDSARIDGDRDYGSFITGEEWQNIMDAVRSDETLMEMSIADVHVDNSPDGGNGRSAVFVSESSSDAVVVFKGTESAAEWADNFDGGNMTDTPHQRNALEWYQQAYEQCGLDSYDVTVTGHSKGGNKSKYITVMDDTVDHCVSFDGQGFSDRFMEQYADRIAGRQDLIENHNVDYDYVNPLLNDIGATTYYEGHNQGSGGFLENHCPNAFFEFREDGSFQMNVNPDGRPEEMAALDAFLNNYLRSMPDDQRDQALDLVNAFINTAFSINGDMGGADIANLFLELAADPEYADDLAYIVAYIIEYEQANPEFAEQLNAVLEAFGLGDATQYVDFASSLFDFRWETIFGTVDFDDLVDLLSSGIENIPSWLLNAVISWLESEYGIVLTEQEARSLLNIVVMANEDMDNIRVEDNGGDIQIPSAPSGASCVFAVRTGALQQAANTLSRTADILSNLSGNVASRASGISLEFSGARGLRARLQDIGSRTEGLAEDMNRLAQAARELAGLYETVENGILAQAEVP